MTSGPGPALSSQAPQAPRSPSWTARETLPTLLCHSQAGSDPGNWFFCPLPGGNGLFTRKKAGGGSGPWIPCLHLGRKSTRSQQGEPAERFTSQSAPAPWLAWMVVANGALCGHRGELAPNTERKAWLRGTSPWPFRRHSPLCWALGSLSRMPSLFPSVRRASLWGPPPGRCPSISRTVAPEGTSLASHTASPAAAAGPTPVSWCPTGSFPGE